MILALLLSLAGPALRADDPPVRVDLNHEQFTRGDRARVYVQTAEDGHLVVLHADPGGRVRVLFPLDPSDDDFVRGGKRVEIRGRSNRDAFFIDANDGAGTVVAVLSADPLTYDAYVRGDHWDFRALGAADLKDDPLAGLLDIARRMAGDSSRFEYDAVSYAVGAQIASRYRYGSGYGYGYGSPFGVGLSFGYPYGYGYDPFCYDPWWGWSFSCSRYAFGYSGYSYGRPYAYRPYSSRPYSYNRFPVFGGRGVTNGTRYVIPPDRVRFSRVQPRQRVTTIDRAPTSRGIIQARSRPSREPNVSRGSSGRRGPSMSPRGGSSRGSSSPRSAGSRGGSSNRGGGGGGRRH